MSELQSKTTEQLKEQSAMISVTLGIKKTELTAKLNRIAAIDPKLMCVLEDAMNDALNLSATKSYIDGMLFQRVEQIAEKAAAESVEEALPPA